MDSYGKPGCKNAVWKKGKKINGYDPNEWRKDIYDNIINYNDHGKTTKYGWEIDHYIPKAKNGSDNITNLHPVQYSKNRKMGIKMNSKDKLNWFTALEEERNIIVNKKTTPFKYEIGELVLVKQTPVSNAQPAIIRSLDILNKKVFVYWVYGEYEENIEMYNKLFTKIPKTRTTNK
jgi:hypothetical protein